MMAGARRFSRWMRRDALPVFLRAGIYDQPPYPRAFREEIPAVAALMRSRVQLRQLYVFAHATAAGWIDAGEQVLACERTALPAFRLADGPFLFALGDAGAAREINTYEQAFALLAYSALYQMSGDAAFRLKAQRLHDWMKRHLALAEGGYALNTQRPPLLSQNPNMHLFEACLNWWRATGDSRWEQESHHLYQLFMRRFFNHRRQCLVEFFAAGWQPALEVSPQVDPGHHHEWTWLLYEYQRQSGIDTAEVRAALQRFARSHGENPASGAVMNELRWDGAPLRAASRLWCQTERIKADVVNCRDGATPGPDRDIDTHVEAMFAAFIHGEPRGLYCDEITSAGERISRPTPSSTLYHLYVACCELDRLAAEQPGVAPDLGRVASGQSGPP
ncbi:AGE family epimerase/isomerase [Sodalis sp. RH21]|uniref:AGE family epimerase/isomerase n=1 Tax=unclassified Sodalis (in: enterobacteria) TaxID=2636512 RepID=UPI0039B504E8